jgi:putative FmdB family regulatory protein
MPYYDYHCVKCGPFALLRGMDQRDQLAHCPSCQTLAQREVTAPNLSLMPATRRQAFARNEKSQHEPGLQKRHRCGSGCGCGSGKSTTRKTTRTVDLGKAGRFEASLKKKRPWMLGH